MGNPPLCRADSKSLTFTGIYKSLQNVHRSLLTNKEAFDESLSKFKSYKMRLQVSPGLDSEIPEKSIIRRSEKISWRRFQRIGTTKGVQGFRRPLHGRSRAYVGFNSSKVCRVISSRLYKG